MIIYYYSLVLKGGLSMRNRTNRDMVNTIVMVLGGFIMFTIAIIAIIDSKATDIVSSIPPTIVGASMFIAGYIGLNIRDQ